MAVTFDSAIGSWNWTFNATQYVPSARDLALAPSRMFSKIGHLFAVPDAVDNIFGIRLGQSTIPAATGEVVGANILEAATTAAARMPAEQQAVHAGQQILLELEETGAGLSSKFTMEGVRSLGNIFSYATSKWALGCILVAVVLNRTNVYARTRWNLNLPWKVRFLLRITPIIMLAGQCRYLLQSIQCQTSPDFAMLRWGNASKHSDLMFTQNGGFLHDLSSTLLFGASDEASCVAVDMIEPVYDEETENSMSDDKMPPLELTGSLSRLWPLFKTFAFSQFIETLSCAVQGRQLAGETGMTFFEHSLAFAEAEGIVGNHLGLGTFGTTKIAQSMSDYTNEEATQIAITRSMIMKRVNTTPEVLLVGFLSAMNHLTSHTLAIFNLQGRLRLANTGFWGLAYMSAIVLSIWTFSVENSPDQSLLRFPTVCIISFIPHVLVLSGILGCSLIYGTALLLSALAPPTEEVGHEDDLVQYQNTFVRRIVAAHRNMQANVSLSTIRVTLHMDFYTALLKTGFSVMTMASEAVYLNESRGVNVKQRTWLEEDRLRELEDIGAQWLGPTFRLHDPDPSIADGLSYESAKTQPSDPLHKSSSGYAREMTAKKASVPGRGRERTALGNGVGATERSGRWYMALEFCLSINRLMLCIMAAAILRGLAAIGIRRQPRFLVWLTRPTKGPVIDGKPAVESSPDALNFYLLNLDGKLELAKDDDVDVEAEMRRRYRSENPDWADHEEKRLDNKLYSWWLSGGWWGNDDNSGTFVPVQTELDDDTTSVVSFSTTEDEEGWESEQSNDDGRRTPTQESPQYSRESTPFHDTTLTTTDLAQLLHPKTPEQRAEAEALAAHLSSDKILTRSRYQTLTQRQRAAVLTSTLYRPANFRASNPGGKLTPDEETQILEHLIISRRQLRAAVDGQPQTWASGASGMGEGGPQCVVCQSSPRSIIVWPCRCLSLCDDCRVSLAMNNFEKCVCCRRDVGSFSRIFVP